MFIITMLIAAVILLAAAIAIGIALMLILGLPIWLAVIKVAIEAYVGYRIISAIKKRKENKYN